VKPTVNLARADITTSQIIQLVSSQASRSIPFTIYPSTIKIVDVALQLQHGLRGFFNRDTDPAVCDEGDRVSC